MIGCIPSGVDLRLVNRMSVNPENQELLHPSSPFLKTHMKDGKVYVFNNWEIATQYDSLDKKNSYINGTGTLFSVNRDILSQKYESKFLVPIDSVLIMETNELIESPSELGMLFVTGMSILGNVACITNPKACFGSCPTFYVSNGNTQIVQAEGFSSSISPSLEATDVDMLYHASNLDETFQIVMKNEAYETHVIDYVDLLLFPKLDNERIFYEENGNFWKTNQIISPNTCTINNLDCLSKIDKMDNLEWFSTTDSLNLAKKEILEIEFNDLKTDNYGLIIGSRQSLLSTFIFYQALSYMGKNVGESLAMTEREEIVPDPHREIFNILGGIEILIQDKQGNWEKLHEIKEMGPIATDLHMISLPSITQKDQSIKLRLSKGNWRINYVALAPLNKKVEPITLKPSSIFYNSKYNSKAMDLLSTKGEKLVTLPGDVYTLNYKIPPNKYNYECFLKSRGYYLEWIRDTWIEEENLDLLLQMNFMPEKTLKDLAPIYKKIESNMEEVFWNSKYEN